MLKNQLSFRDSTITYYVFGRGPRLAICFHGYGEDGQGFGFLEEFAGERFTFIAMDLPFHGGTAWKDGLNFSVEDLKEIIESIIAGNLKAHKPGEYRFTVMGFSLGGRIALSFYQLMPEKFERILLLAPDGLKVNGWYWLSTQTWLGNRFFSFTMKHPTWFFGFLKMVNRLGFVNASVFKFIKAYIGDANFRKLLYCRWTTLRKLRPHLKQIKSAVKKYQTPVRLVYGKHDRIILSTVGERFRKGIEKECSLVVIESGHQVLQRKHAMEIAELLAD